VDTSVGQFAQNLVHHGEGKLAVNPSNGLIKLENVLSDCNINRQAENSVFPKISWTTSSFVGKTSHSFNQRFRCNNIKYRETGIVARRSNTSLAHRLQSYLTLLTSHFAVRIHSVRYYVHTNSFYTHDNPNSFNFVRDTPHNYTIIQHVYIYTAYVGRVA